MGRQCCHLRRSAGPSTPDLLAEYKADQKNNTAHNKRSRLIGWLTLGAVVAYAGITALQWWKMRETLLVDQRAWVGATEFNVALTRDLKVEVAFKNTGKTPALDFHAAAAIEWQFKNANPKLAYSESDAISRVALFPDGTHSLIATDQSGKFTQAHADSITAGELILYVAGTAWYMDIFKDPHQTLFCASYDAKAKKMASCEFHNSAN